MLEDPDTSYHDDRERALASPVDAKVLRLLRDETTSIADRWASEASRVPFARVSDYTGTDKIRSERLRSFLSALLGFTEDPRSVKTREIIRSAIRSEHLRTVSHSRMMSNHLLLRPIMLDLVDDRMPEKDRPEARRTVSRIVDRVVEEVSVLIEEHLQMQSIMVRCLSSAPGDRAELEQAFARFCRTSMDYFDSDFVAVFRFMPETRELMCIGCSAKGLAIPKDSRTSLSSFPLAEMAIDQRVPKTCIPPSWAPGPRRKVLGQMGFDHCIVVPLMRLDEPLGVLFIADTSGPTTFTPDEVSLAEDLSTNIVRVMENVDLFEKLSIRSRAQTALIETAASLQKEIESTEMFRIVSDKIAELIPCNELAFYMLDWDRRVGNPVYATGPYSSEVMEDRDFPIDVGFLGHVTRTKRAEIIQDTEDDERGAYIPGTPATHSRMLAVPIIGRKDVLGVIELLKYPPDNFTNEDLEVATMFANHAAVAIENAKLLTEVSTTRDQLELHMDLLTHDMANYTTPVMAYIETIRKRQDMDPELARAVERTQEQVDNIMQLVDTVRTMAMVRESRFPRCARTDLRPALEAAVSDARVRLRGHAPLVSLELPEAPVRVMADPLLKDIFVNLFAAVARPSRRDEARLVVRAEPRTEGRKDFWHVKVENPGRSIPDHLKKEVLRMTKGSKSELTGGLGIGLAAARDAVERYSGRMWVSDLVPRDPAKGCVFNMTFPKAD